MNIYVARYETDDDRYYATFSTRKKALDFIAENAKSLYDERPDDYWPENSPDMLTALERGNGETVLEEWAQFSGEAQFFTLIETELDEGFTSGS